MAAPSPQDLIAERVERLLVRYEQLQHTNALMAQQIATTQESDSLRSRLQAARHRIDVLIERLPTTPAPRTTHEAARSANHAAELSAGCPEAARRLLDAWSAWTP
jgi:cell division septum initiation protein DivIVA